MNADAKIAIAEPILGYEFRNKLLCAEALQMAGPGAALVIGGQIHCVNLNRRIAVLGDAAAATVLSNQWYWSRDLSGNPQAPEFWTATSQAVLSNVGLARLGNSLGLATAIITAPGHEGNPGTKMMATAVEALLGAVYIDGGEEALRRVMKHFGLTHEGIRGMAHPRILRERHREGPRPSQPSPWITSLLT